MTEDKTVVEGLGNAIEHLTKKEQEAAVAMEVFSKNVKEATGKDIRQPCNALDVLRLMHRYYGEPKGD